MVRLVESSEMVREEPYSAGVLSRGALVGVLWWRRGSSGCRVLYIVCKYSSGRGGLRAAFDQILGGLAEGGFLKRFPGSEMVRA